MLEIEKFASPFSRKNVTEPSPCCEILAVGHRRLSISRSSYIGGAGSYVSHTKETNKGLRNETNQTYLESHLVIAAGYFFWSQSRKSCKSYKHVSLCPHHRIHWTEYPFHEYLRVSLLTVFSYSNQLDAGKHPSIYAILNVIWSSACTCVPFGLSLRWQIFDYLDTHFFLSRWGNVKPWEFSNLNSMHTERH